MQLCQKYSTEHYVLIQMQHSATYPSKKYIAWMYEAILQQNTPLNVKTIYDLTISQIII